MFKEVDLGLRKSLFLLYEGKPRKEEKLRKEEVACAFNDKNLKKKGDEVVVKLAIVHLLASFLFGTQTETRVDNSFFTMVDTDFVEMKKFAFGKVLWQRTRCVMRAVLKDRNAMYDYVLRKADGSLDNHSYKCYGFPIAFLIWIYETIPSCSQALCRRVNYLFPRILNWTSRGSVSYQYLVDNVLLEEEYDINVIIPTNEEMRLPILRGLSFESKFFPTNPPDDDDANPSDMH
ncbi:uncharacterized protein LOC133799661 [Humulus lupulus]|uniref:uncharacterized protein LOC133799661 n=1 Tax=Humulus lupulus TaxID=3486 RepID=UPI002B4102C8|nr:uncharacterized protein LOC133799661 [Humulus lupulus]